MARILVVDDSQFIRVLLRRILTDQGHIIAGEANNGTEAVEMFARLRPDLVTLDIVMPVLNGLEALKRIIQIDSRAKVIMVTALGQEPLAIEAVKLGATDYVVKPFKPDQLAVVVGKVLNAPVVDQAYTR
ncbi:MAG: response regulator [Candidatus Odinarchaeota archaeon]